LRNSFPPLKKKSMNKIQINNFDILDKTPVIDRKPFTPPFVLKIKDRIGRL